jgi:uncharacterized membrane protein YjfL (UPF0719 family)
MTSADAAKELAPLLSSIARTHGASPTGCLASAVVHRSLRLDGAVATLDLGALGHAVIASLVFALLGILVFGAAFWVITKVAPFSIRKEIEEDQNTSLGIVIGAVIIGLSLIISAAIKG